MLKNFNSVCTILNTDQADNTTEVSQNMILYLIDTTVTPPMPFPDNHYAVLQKGDLLDFLPDVKVLREAGDLRSRLLVCYSVIDTIPGMGRWLYGVPTGRELMDWYRLS